MKEAYKMAETVAILLLVIPVMPTIVAGLYLWRKFHPRPQAKGELS